MVYRRGMALRPINSRKNIVDDSGVLPAGSSTLLFSATSNSVLKGVDNAVITAAEEVDVGSKVMGVFLSLFFASDSNVPAATPPLLDFYVLYDKTGAVGSAFTATGLPTPGNTGVHQNKGKIFHEEKGLTGEKNDGFPMIFKSVIKIPRNFQRIGFDTRIRVVARANDDTVYCAKAIYKWFS